MLLPVSVADESHGSGAFAGVGAGEVASHEGLDAEDLQEFGRDACDHGARRLRTSGNRGDVCAVLGDGLESVILIAKVVEVRVSEPRPGALGIDLEHGHDTVRIVVGQRTQQDSIDHAENGGGGADGES